MQLLVTAQRSWTNGECVVKTVRLHVQLLQNCCSTILQQLHV